MVNHGLISMTMFLLAGMVERRTATGELSRARRDGPRPTGARDGPDDRRRDRARRAALVELRRRVPDPGRRLPAGLGLGRGRRGRDRARRHVHAAADLRRPAPRRRPGRERVRARPAHGELAIVVPLVALLLVLSAWPDAISGHSFRATGFDGVDQERSRRSEPSDPQAPRRLVRALALTGAARRYGGSADGGGVRPEAEPADGRSHGLRRRVRHVPRARDPARGQEPARPGDRRRRDLPRPLGGDGADRSSRAAVWSRC